MKVLILSQHFWPESFRINEVAAQLRDNGCEVSVLTGKPNYPQGDVFPGYRASGTQREDFAGIPVYRVPLVARGRGRAVELALNYLSFIFFASLLGPWLLRGQRFDVIFVYGTSPILQAIPGVFLKWLKGAKLAVWVQDLWPQSLEVTGFVRNRRVLAAVAKVVSWIYRRADLLLVQSHAFIGAVKDMAGTTPVEYYPNPGEAALHQRGLVDEPGPQLEPGFNLVFAGNMGTVQSLDCVLDAAQLLLPYEDVRVVLVGSGRRSEWLENEVARRSLRNVQLAGRFPPQAMPDLFAQASALLVSLVSDPAMNLTVPSKLQAYLAAGRPVIASLDGEGARVVSEAGAGFACRAEDPAALAQAVLSLRAMAPAEREAMGRAGRDYYLANFDPAPLALRLAARFRELQ
ncbi:glycosyltransferase family 4 protein [Caenimonas soli]|uniref:glycosyltransferase family 4 protein n=1 Tax=Caenimonas soli TaxID=2735555 RepID=UPI0015557230|nr:glycosyltransferase family 4 protein [Caenimonas soli]NPC55766.1 glycosyltransferase family 4 protein [Caenimonas soli]